MPPRISSLKFLLLGASDCNNPKAITKKQILQWQEEGIITYLGANKDVRPFIESSSCVVLPSFYKEGVPRVLLEAMSMGKPIITTNVSGCKECVIKPYTPLVYKDESLLLGINGILIPPQNPNALQAAMYYLATHKNLTATLGRQGRKLAKKLFDMPLITYIYTTSVTHILHTQTPALQSQTTHNLSQDSQHSIIVCISNTCFGMYNFRLQPLVALQNNGFAIHIIAPFDESTSKLQSHGFICHPLTIDSKSLNPFKDLRTIWQILKLLRHLKPKLLFNYTIKSVIYGSFASRILNIPTIAVITGLGYVFIGKEIKKKILRFIVCQMYKTALKCVKEVWFLNPDDKEEFLQRELVSQTQAKLLPSEGVDTEYFAPQSQNLHNAAQPQEEFVFLLIARMLWDKGVGEFVEAAKMLQKNNKKSNGGGAIKFYLLGKLNVANPSAIAESIIQKWEREGIIKYLGEQNDVRPFIESSSCVVLPSYREGAPMVLLEALSMGKPIITTNVSGCKELITPKIGSMCQAKDSVSLAKSMSKMLHLSPRERMQMKQNARNFVLTKHDKRLIVERYINAAQIYSLS